jgi:glycerol-3-phosphate O-acyltransferase
MNPVMVIKKINKIICRFLVGTTQHFSCQLPSHMDSVRHFLFNLLFNRIGFTKDQADVIKNLPENACVVYVNKFKSTFEVLFSYFRLSTMDLAGPTIAVDYRLVFFQSFRKWFQTGIAVIYRLFRREHRSGLFHGDYLGLQLQKGEAAFLSLVEKHDFYQRFVKRKTDPLTYLIELQGRIDRPIVIVPQIFFYSQKSATTTAKPADLFFGSEQRPGGLRKFFKVLLKPEKMFVEYSKPLNLQKFLKKEESADRSAGHLALVLRRNLLSQMTRHRQSTTGPVLKSFDELKLGILTNDDLQTYMKKHAVRKNTSVFSARRQAMAYFDEIAARYRPGFTGLAVRIIKWLSGTVFDGIHIDTGRLEAVKRMALKGPVIFVPCHRSHIDSMVMLYVMFLNHMSPPHFFAGKNLSFWPLGPLLRMAGTFFVRRSFRGAVFYTKVFSAYIHELLKEGFHITVFIEGTRSRSGKLLQPQLGMINILLNAFENKACRDLIFVPVYIGYERVPEEKEYVHEIEGGKKKQESARQILKVPKLLKKRYGKIFVKFTDPIGLNDYIRQKNLPVDDLSAKQKNFVCRELGNRIMGEIDRATIAVPRSIVAAALLNSRKKTRTIKGLMDQIQTYVSYLLSRDVSVSDSLTAYPRHITGHILDLYAQAKIVEVTQTEPGEWRDTDTLAVRENKRHVLEYYKNNTITHFIPAAHTALSILARDAFMFSTTDITEGYRFLDGLFGLEFIRDNEQPVEFQLRKCIKVFIDAELLTPHPTQPETYTITSPGYRKLKQFAAFLKPFIESYGLVLKWLARQAADKRSSKDRLKKVLLFGNILLKQGEIERPETLSKFNIENALSYFSKAGLHGKEDAQLITFYEDRIDLYQKRTDS